MEPKTVFQDMDGHCQICGNQSDVVIVMEMRNGAKVYIPYCESHMPERLKYYRRFYINEQICEEKSIEVPLPTVVKSCTII